MDTDTLRFARRAVYGATTHNGSSGKSGHAPAAHFRKEPLPKDANQETEPDPPEDPLKRTTLALAVLTCLVVAAPHIGAHAGPNLLPNPSFEASALEPDPVEQGTLPQPVLPEGWAFEGVAGLFDHTPNAFRTGARSVAISVPASTNERYCLDPSTCAENPINGPRDAARAAYSITPVWRTLDPIAVSPGSYTARTWAMLSVGIVGEGVTLSVRWLDASGVPIGQEVVDTRLRSDNDPETTPWFKLEGTVSPPAGAAGAHVLLGYTDDLQAIGQGLFDDAFFGRN